MARNFRGIDVRILLMAVLFVGWSAPPGLSGDARQDPSGPAEKSAGGSDRENEQMIPVPRWNLPADLSGFEIQDLYKHIHHATMGPGHAIPSKELAESYLMAEWSRLGSTRPDEEILELLVQEAPFVRIHLRPFRDRGGSVDSLLKAFLRSAGVPRDSAAFVSAWTEVGEAVSAGRLPFRRSAFDSLDATMRARGYPAVHHSERYLHTYDPAYRVLDRQQAEELLQTLRQGGTTP